jgi:HNH endonuclease
MKAALERLVWRRAHARCEYCQISQAVDESPFEIDHIFAVKHRGKTIAQNLALACFSCNKHKSSDLSGIDPETEKIVRLFHPRRMKWQRHFRWDGPWLVGRTAIGRTTIATLQINSPLRVRLRIELMANDEFPPE